MPKPESRPKICDYEGSNYRTEFWENTGRDYEDQVERLALRRLLPSNGRRLLEIGAGFGRLTDEYHAYEQVVLVDYSLSQLQYAQERYGRSNRFVYVAADAYRLPFRPGIFDAATMIRVIHHMADVPAVLAEIRRVIAPEGTFVLEHANKHNLKAILRYALKKQDWNPHTLDPVEFVELNFDFHPDYIREHLQAVGFDLKKRLPVSFFRLSLLKDNVPTSLLVNLDSALQHTRLLLSPSVFTLSTAQGQTTNNVDIPLYNAGALFVSPDTGSELIRKDDTLLCEASGARWAIRDGIYDFKAPLES